MIERLRQWLSGEPPPAAAVPPRLRILMVCTGNICRSPTAEGVLRHKLEQAGLGATHRLDVAQRSGARRGPHREVRPRSGQQFRDGHALAAN